VLVSDGTLAHLSFRKASQLQELVLDPESVSRHASSAVISALAHDAFGTGAVHVELAVIGHLASPMGTHLPTHFGLFLVHLQTGLFVFVQSQSVGGSALLPLQVHSLFSSFVHLQSSLITLHASSSVVHVS
jgi:hypothetical protein